MLRVGPGQKLKADLHIHTAEDPCDNIKHTAIELIDRASQQNFDVLAITNHQAITFTKKLESYAARKGILLIPGTEIMVDSAHALVINPRFKITKERYRLDEMPGLKDDKSLWIAPHPFFFLSKSLRSRIYPWLPCFDALEFSSYYSNVINPNQKALRIASLSRKPVIGNSDAHALWQFGKTYSLIDSEKDTASVIEAIKTGKVEIRSSPYSLAQIGWLFMKSITFDRIWHTLKL